MLIWTFDFSMACRGLSIEVLHEVTRSIPGIAPVRVGSCKYLERVPDVGSDIETISANHPPFEPRHTRINAI